jgi:hypothetical protein
MIDWRYSQSNLFVLPHNHGGDANPVLSTIPATRVYKSGLELFEIDVLLNIS